MSMEQIMHVASTPKDALAAVVLLDQIPRNVYRGQEAVKVHRDFDPLALRLAKAYLSPPYEYGDRKHCELSH